MQKILVILQQKGVWVHVHQIHMVGQEVTNMAKIRIGFSTHFEVENELVGIGTDNPTNTKQVLGNIKSSDAKVIGITTLTLSLIHI